MMWKSLRPHIILRRCFRVYGEWSWKNSLGKIIVFLYLCSNFPHILSELESIIKKTLLMWFNHIEMDLINSEIILVTKFMGRSTCFDIKHFKGFGCSQIFIFKVLRVKWKDLGLCFKLSRRKKKTQLTNPNPVEQTFKRKPTCKYFITMPWH